jgi:hypothetical protein
MSDVGLVRSDRCGLDELFLAYATGDAERGRLALEAGWPRRWTAEWRSAGGEVACAAEDLYSVPLAGCKPVRRFSWRRRQQHDPSGFEAALRSLARELSAPGTPLISYQRRRQALENWAVDEPAWDGLIARLPDAAVGRTPDLGDRRRQVASVYVWVRVTFGEPGFAPRPIEAAQAPAVREHWRQTWNFTWWSLLTKDNPGSIYSCLRAELDALATALATTIDPAVPAGSTLGAASLYLSRYPRRPRKPRALTPTIH